jgi:hypothetical protein
VTFRLPGSWVTILAGSEPHALSPAVPSTCPKQQSATVAYGQPRSLAEVAGLGHRRLASSQTLLPKLAVRIFIPFVFLLPKWSAKA